MADKPKSHKALAEEDKTYKSYFAEKHTTVKTKENAMYYLCTLHECPFLGKCPSTHKEISIKVCKQCIKDYYKNKEGKG